jgi:hypothetical protein
MANLIKGDRVVLSPEALSRGIGTKSPKGRIGTVDNKPRKGSSRVQVLWDGRKSPESYHITFVTKAEKEQ